jgi:sugar lactone lactonase YvrE
MNKQNILALALKPAMRTTKSVGIGIVLLLAAALVAIITPSAATAAPPCEGPTVTRLVTGLVQGAKGSTIGPDGALYVTEGAAGRISRVDPLTGEKTTFASGLPPAILSQTYRGGFLVTDGHHNRVLRVTLDGEVTELIQFDNIVPTGLAVRGNTVYMAEAGPVPHLPQNGKVVVRAELVHRHGGGLRRPTPR